MKILNFTFYIIDHIACEQLLSYLKQNPESIWRHIRKNVF